MDHELFKLVEKPFAFPLSTCQIGPNMLGFARVAKSPTAKSNKDLNSRSFLLQVGDGQDIFLRDTIHRINLKGIGLNISKGHI